MRSVRVLCVYSADTLARSGSEVEAEISETMAKFVQPTITFQKLLDTPTTPSRGATIGKPHADANMRAYTYMFWIKAAVSSGPPIACPCSRAHWSAQGVANGFNNILHHGHAQWQNSIGVYMWPGTTWLFVWSSHPWHWWQYAWVGPLVVVRSPPPVLSLVARA